MTNATLTPIAQNPHFAWEVTDEDVEIVLGRHGITDPQSVIDGIDGVDLEEVEKAVLEYTDFDDQCNAALEDIERQLIFNDVLPKNAELLFKLA